MVENLHFYFEHPVEARSYASLRLKMGLNKILRPLYREISWDGNNQIVKKMADAFSTRNFL